MFSIVEIKGKQYRVSPGEEIRVDLMQAKEGDDAKDIKVLLIKTEAGDVKIGKPYVDTAKVKAKVLGEVRGEKKVSIRFKGKSGYVKTNNIKPRYTRLKIESIAG